MSETELATSKTQLIAPKGEQQALEHFPVHLSFS